MRRRLLKFPRCRIADYIPSRVVSFIFFFFCLEEKLRRWLVIRFTGVLILLINKIDQVSYIYTRYNKNKQRD